MLEKTFLSLMFAMVLGVTLTLTPLMLLPTGRETYGEMKPETPKSTNFAERAETAEKTETLTLTVHAAPIVKFNWLDLVLTVVFGAIPAAFSSIIVKRKLRV
ncbi:MAG: hypothetical protein QXW55_05200 [Candidatus Bathyarchaeia archaeon]